MSTPISHLEKLGYQIEYSIFTNLDKTTEQTKWLRPPAFLAFGASSLTKLVVRTFSIAELAIHGLGLVLSSAPSSENRAYGWSLLKRVPEQGLNILAIFPGLLIDPVIIFREPKFYILTHAEHIKVAFRHAKAGTIGNQDYKKDSQNAIGMAKEKLIEWQEAN